VIPNCFFERYQINKIIIVSQFIVI
jgi:hypothetical protein